MSRGGRSAEICSSSARREDKRLKCTTQANRVKARFPISKAGVSNSQAGTGRLEYLAAQRRKV